MHELQEYGEVNNAAKGTGVSPEKLAALRQLKNEAGVSVDGRQQRTPMKTETIVAPNQAANTLTVR